MLMEQRCGSALKDESGCGWSIRLRATLCSSDPLVHFGLGSATQIESILVTWPDGRPERFPGGPADRTIEIRKGEGQAP